MKLSNKLILGTANFFINYGILKNRVNHLQIIKILNYARKQKINFLDFSKDYNLNKNFFYKLKKFKLFIKINLNSIKNVVDLEKNLFCNISKKEFICHGVTLRKPALLLNNKGKKIYRVLNELKQKNKINKIGLSIYNTHSLKKVINNYNIDYIELPLNLVNVDIFNKTKKIIAKKKIKIHARSIFLQGLLLKKHNQLPERLKKLKKYWKKMDDLFKNMKISRHSACVNFVLSHKIDKIVFGINNLNNIKELFLLKKIKSNIPYFNIKEKNLIDPIYWAKNY